MNLAKLYQDGFYGSNIVELHSVKLSKLLKWIKKAEDKRIGNTPVFFGLHIMLFSDMSGYVVAECWPPTEKKEVDLLGFHKLEI
jgi:hypothetical protein